MKKLSFLVLLLALIELTVIMIIARPNTPAKYLGTYDLGTYDWEPTSYCIDATHECHPWPPTSTIN